MLNHENSAIIQVVMISFPYGMLPTIWSGAEGLTLKPDLILPGPDNHH